MERVYTKLLPSHLSSFALSDEISIKKNNMEQSQEKLLKHYRLNQQEYEMIKELLGYEPSRLELALFSALWSEHCSYKSSIVHLKKLFFDSDRVMSAMGENAGVIDLGQGEKVAFKIESHNHPSQITPYHGAATGVGGILRDVFVMNARPVALANYLCFGSPSVEHTEELLNEVVQGIGGYGNSIGIPTVTGQTEFHPSYSENVVVNALALGYFGPGDEIMSSKAKGPGNLLVYVGARTGRDGIHGASMASESFSVKQAEKKEDKKACVQIGDPFFGKLLMEACLEAMRKKLVVAAQDMGAAGLISSSFEMISKGALGMKLYLDKVPLRDSSMTAEEILLSESQERVLLLVQPDKYSELKEVFEKWELPVCVIGELKAESDVELFWKEKCIVQIAPQLLTEKAPRYNRPYSVWVAQHQTENASYAKCSLANKDCSDLLLSLLKDARACSREFIYKQYDQRVRANTVKDCTFPFGVIRLPDSGRALALCMGGRPHIMRMDSLEGGKDTVYEPALQLATRGFQPLALTDGLNFASPEKKEVMSSFVACVEGMAQASRSLDTPVVSGNVSFYNETKDKGISPTPATAMIGIKDSLNVPGQFTQNFHSSFIYLISAHQIFSKGMTGEFFNEDPNFHGSLNPKLCRDFIHQVLKASSLTSPLAVSVVGKFGLAYTLARMMIDRQVDLKEEVVTNGGRDCGNDSRSHGHIAGMEIETCYDLFQERLYEIVVVLKEQDTAKWEKLFSSHPNFKMEKLGVVTEKPCLCINSDIILSIVDLKKTYSSSFFT